MKMNGMGLLPEDIFAVFGRLGFSRYEAKVYATLCACGRLKMQELATYSTVPQSKLYAVVEGLEHKGAVVVSRVRISTAESVSLRHIVATRMRQYMEDAQKISAYVEAIQSTEAFKHLCHTRRIALRSNGALSSPPQD
jgi:sugar-specific transcriptional regulator TrmB